MKFNETLTNEVVSVEQLGPEAQLLKMSHEDKVT